MSGSGDEQAALERREFLRKFGRFAAATTPLITAVLSAPASADSWFSGGHKCKPYRHCRGGGGGGFPWDGGFGF
jgi:hypothetical protein